MKRYSNKYSDPIENMVNKLAKNNINPNCGFPIVASLVYKNFELINTNVNLRYKPKDEINIKPSKPIKKTYFKNHAEYICFSNVKETYLTKELIIFVTIPPCNNCFKIISEKTNWKIIYFFDDIRFKAKEEGYLETYIKTEKIIRKSPSYFNNINIMFNVYYIVIVCLSGFIFHTEHTIKDKVLISVSKKWLTNFQNAINKKDIKDKKDYNKHTLNLINNAKEMNINEINSIKKLKEIFNILLPVKHKNKQKRV